MQCSHWQGERIVYFYFYIFGDRKTLKASPLEFIPFLPKITLVARSPDYGLLVEIAKGLFKSSASSRVDSTIRSYLATLIKIKE